MVVAFGIVMFPGRTELDVVAGIVPVGGDVVVDAIVVVGPVVVVGVSVVVVVLVGAVTVVVAITGDIGDAGGGDETIPVAVKGPIAIGVEGRLSARPVEGTGLGIGTSTVISPLESVGGLAPVASTFVTALPTMTVFPSAAAAPTIGAGSDNVVW